MDVRQEDRELEQPSAWRMPDGCVRLVPLVGPGRVVDVEVQVCRDQHERPGDDEHAPAS